MRRLVLSVAALVAAVVFAGVLAGCSNSGLDSNEVSNVKILTKHVKLIVGSDSLIPTRASDKQSRFETILPPGGVGTIKYRFTKGEILHAFTKIAGDKFQKSDLTCTEVDSVTGKASFEGDLKYTEENQDVYLWLGNYRDWGGTNVLALNPGINISAILDPYKGRIIDSDGYSVCQYGKTTVTSLNKGFGIQLNMVTSLATMKIDDSILNAVEEGGDYSTTVHLDVSDVSNLRYFNFETGEAINEFGILASVLSKSELKSIINDYNGLISYPISLGNHPYFKITATSSAFMKNFKWESKPFTFRTVIGKPSEVDDPANHVYSANRNFFFGTVDMQEVK